MSVRMRIELNFFEVVYLIMSLNIAILIFFHVPKLTN